MAAVLVIMALVGLTAGAFTATRSSKDGRKDDGPELTGEAKNLLDLLEKKDARTYHARYTGSSPDSSGIVLETWQSPPRIRQDSEVTIRGQVARTSSFVLDAKRVRCTKLSDRPWQCRPDTGLASPDPLAAIRARLGEGEVTARTTSVQNRTVRCFRFTTDGATNELCVLPDKGIPVTVRAGTSTLTLRALEMDVEASVFEPPAEVVRA